MSRLAALAGALILAAGLAVAAEAPVTVRGGEHKGFGRLVFDFAASTPYTAEIVDGALLVTFPAAARFDLSPLSRDLEDYIGPSRAGDDGKSVRIPLKAGFTLKHYTLGPKLVIDLIGPPQGLKRTAAEKAPSESETASEGNAASESKMAAETPPAAPLNAPATVPSNAPADPVQPAGQPQAKVMVRVGEHPGFSRLVFDWPASVPVRIEQTPGKATLWFGRPGELDLSRYRQDPPERVSALVPRPVAEGLAVDLALPKGATLKHYIDGAQVVVDVVGGEPPASQVAQPAQPAKETMAAAKPAAEPAPQKQAKTADAEAPKQQAAATPTATPTELLPQGMKGQAAAGEAGGKTAEAAKAPAAKTPAEAPKTAANEQAPATSTKASPETAKQQPAAAPEIDLVSANSAPAEASGATPGEPAKPRRSIALRFNWAEPVGAAAFLYSGRLWLVFDRPVQSNIADKITKAAPTLNPVEQLDHPAATILRLRLPVGFTAQFRTEEDDWIVDLRRHESEIPRALEAVVDYADEQARLRVALQAPGQVLQVTDPDLGATLWVVPSRTAGLALPRQFSLPELRLLPTFQGLAVEPRADHVTVALDEQGALIAGDGGLNVSDATIRDSQSSDQLAFDTSRRLLDLEAWRGAQPLLTRKQELQQDTVQAEPGETDLARLDLARFYFAHGLASEALGALQLIDRESNRLAADPQILLLRGASELLSDEVEAAAKDLLHPALDGEWDAHLWRGALAAAGEDWPTAAQILRESEPLIGGYPDAVRNRLWLLAAEAQLQIAAGADGGAVAQEYLDQVRANAPTVFDKARIDYLEGKRLALEDDAEGAVELWRKVAEGGYGAAAARARLALIDQGLEDGTLSRVDATTELEHLQFAWRGDAFEFSLLQRLGELYLEQNRFRDALLTLRQAASYLPQAARSKAIAQRMRDVFSDLFLTDLGARVPPVAALAIYREFRELTPGGTVGDQLVARLAERLVEVDLLDQAAELLQGQIEHRLAGVDRAATGNRVAMLHLMDQRPKDAIEVLDQTTLPDLPQALADERRFLRARALIDSERSGEGLALLGDDKSTEAQRLRAQVYWTERRWPEAAKALEALLPEALAAEPVAAEQEARLIASLAVAYTLAGDRNGLSDLDWRYGNFMARTTQADAFAMLTGDLNGAMITSIADELSGVQTIQAFMADYRDRLTTPDEGVVN